MSADKKIAIITGASSGIGRTTAVTFAKAGWNVVLTARRLSALEETKQLCGSDERCLIVAGDVTDEVFVQTLFTKAVEHFGRVDLVFNNAGVAAPGVPVEDLSLADFQDVMNVNVTGPFLCTREAFRTFKKQSPQGGRIINNGSLAAHTPRPHAFPYTCSKHAITGLTKCTALDGRRFGITCTQIDIGNANTLLMSSGMHASGSLQPNGDTIVEDRFDPQQVADTILHIANLPSGVQVLDIKIMAAKAPFVGRG